MKTRLSTNPTKQLFMKSAAMDGRSKAPCEAHLASPVGTPTRSDHDDRTNQCTLSDCGGRSASGSDGEPATCHSASR
jgi:hypothetical protein